MNSVQNSSPPSISVALATYNGARFLTEQLESIRAQTRPPLELVITDDRSSDDTLNIINRFAQTAPFPVHLYVNQERLGYAENFLHAASLCTAPLIAFCDQDDRWLPEKLSRCAAAMLDLEVQLCLHAAQTWNGEQVFDQLYPRVERAGIFLPPALDPFWLVPGFAMVIRRELLQITDNSARLCHMLDATSANGKPQAHDDWCWFLAATTGKVVLLDEVLAFYRQHDTNVAGAPVVETATGRLALAIADVQYGPMAQLEAQYAQLVAGLVPKLPMERQAFARQSAEALSLRSACHHIRAELYDRQSTAWKRLSSFLKLLRTRAYRDLPSNNLLGKRALLKDLLFGVPGLHRRR